jgi:glycosyltransferase involved in cell wall biosynthesis
MLAMGKAAAGAGLDITYFPASYSFFPVWNVGRVVVTLHDTLALAHPSLVCPSWRGRVAWALKEHAAVRWADRIITVSESARSDLIAWFKLNPERVRVVSEGPAPVFGPKRKGHDSEQALKRCGLDPTAPFVLYVGGLSPHKNLSRLVQAFARSGLAGEGVRLVLVGDIGDVFHTHVPELRAVVADCGIEDAVVFTGFVPDDDLVFLYNRAEFLVQPSLMEGFGLPTVEAMACGTAIVSSTAGSLREVVGEAGIFFDPESVDEIAAAIRTVHRDRGMRAELAAKASKRAGRFQWSASARALVDVFEELGPARNGRRRHSA